MLFKKSFLLVLMLLLLIPTTIIQAEDGVTVEAEGMSTITNGNMDRAREVAILDAKRQAVEAVVGTFIDARTEVNNFQSIRDNISASSNGFVASYEILNTSAVNNIYTVRIKAVVKKDAVRQKVDELKQTINSAGKPRVMVLISEDPEGQIIAAEVIKTLITAGFPVVDQTQSERAKQTESGRKAMAGDSRVISQLASESNAELLIIGKASFSMIGNFQGLISGRGTLEVKAIRSATGQVLASTSFTDTGVDIAEVPAARKAFTKIAGKTGPFLQSELGKQLVDNQRNLQLVLHGITYSNLKLFQQRLKNTAFITNIYLRSFIDNLARIDLDTSLLAEQLADEIIGWNDLPLDIIGISGNKIEIKQK